MFDNRLLVSVAGVVGANGDREFAHGRDLGGGGKGFNANIQLAGSNGREPYRRLVELRPLRG